MVTFSQPRDGPFLPTVFPGERMNGVQAQFTFSAPALFAFRHGWPKLLIQRVGAGRELGWRVGLGEGFEGRLHGGVFAAERPREIAPYTGRFNGLAFDRRPDSLARLDDWHGSAEHRDEHLTTCGARA